MEYHSSHSASPVVHAGQMLRALRLTGVRPAEDIAAHLFQHSGGTIQFTCFANKRHKKNGLAVLHLDNKPAGTNENWAF